MIRSFRSKPLQRFFETDDASKLPVPQHAARVRRQLNALDAATVATDLNIPGWRFHGLHGRPKRWAVDASGNYRITFGFDGPDATAVDLEDYH